MWGGAGPFVGPLNGGSVHQGADDSGRVIGLDAGAGLQGEPTACPGRLPRTLGMVGRVKAARGPWEVAQRVRIGARALALRVGVTVVTVVTVV